MIIKLGVLSIKIIMLNDDGRKKEKEKKRKMKGRKKDERTVLEALFHCAIVIIKDSVVTYVNTMQYKPCYAYFNHTFCSPYPFSFCTVT